MADDTPPPSVFGPIDDTIAVSFPHVLGATGYRIYEQPGGFHVLDHWIPATDEPRLVAEIEMSEDVE